MARRRGRPNNYLMVDDNTGFTTYADRLQQDYWGNWSKYGLKRNLQEISSPLGDPYPVPVFRGSQYEATTACQFELQPRFVGKTTKPFPTSQYGQLVDLDPAIPDMAVGCTFLVR
jgi:hypothetical protein